MTERERLYKIIENSKVIQRCGCHYNNVERYINELTDYLLNNNVIVPPYKVVWFIENRYTERQCVTGVSIENLPLNIVRNLDKYRYYATKEEAIKALKDCEK